ncbi:MAG: ferredoxin [bacterium]
MIAIVDSELCIGCGQCEELCPDVFEILDEKAQVISDEIPEDILDTCYEAVESCPVDAIVLEEDE